MYATYECEFALVSGKNARFDVPVLIATAHGCCFLSLCSFALCCADLHSFCVEFVLVGLVPRPTICSRFVCRYGTDQNRSFGEKQAKAETTCFRSFTNLGSICTNKNVSKP